MLKKLITGIALNAMSKQMKKITTDIKRASSHPQEDQKVYVPEDSDVSVRIIDVMEFTQPSTFRGFKRYTLTTYKEPGIAENIEFFRNNKVTVHFQIKEGTPIQLIIKEKSGLFVDGHTFQVLEVYASGRKIGVMYDYDNEPQFRGLFDRPFDAACVRIEETIGEGPEFDGIEVYLFVHYVE